MQTSSQILDAPARLAHHEPMRAAAVTLLGLLLVLPTAAPAQMYRWEDDHGTLYYTNAPEKVPEPDRGELPPLAPEPATAVGVANAPRPVDVPAPPAVTRIPYTAGDAILVSATIGGN